MADVAPGPVPAAAPGDAVTAEPRVTGAVRVLLAVYAASNALVGLWAGAFPRSFYDDFPGLGRHWVAVDGPYNEHLVRDVGWLNLALATVLLVAVVRATPLLVGVAAGAALVYAAPHLAYHLANLDVYDTSDQVANVVALGVGVAVPAGVLWWAARHGARG
ncbi:MAG TPA: hypothetical protein VF743_02445 [Acidimicrobiales bacterium]